MRDKKPVSYTHLDVYKRQELVSIGVLSSEEPTAATIPTKRKKPRIENRNKPTMVAKTYLINCHMSIKEKKCNGQK